MMPAGALRSIGMTAEVDSGGGQRLGEVAALVRLG
jgi:hypothetical protein